MHYIRKYTQKKKVIITEVVHYEISKTKTSMFSFNIDDHTTYHLSLQSSKAQYYFKLNQASFIVLSLNKLQHSKLNKLILRLNNFFCLNFNTNFFSFKNLHTTAYPSPDEPSPLCSPTIHLDSWTEGQTHSQLSALSFLVPFSALFSTIFNFVQPYLSFFKVCSNLSLHFKICSILSFYHL